MISKLKASLFLSLATALVLAGQFIAAPVAQADAAPIRLIGVYQYGIPGGPGTFISPTVCLSVEPTSSSSFRITGGISPLAISGPMYPVTENFRDTGRVEIYKGNTLIYSRDIDYNYQYTYSGPVGETMVMTPAPRSFSPLPPPDFIATQYELVPTTVVNSNAAGNIRIKYRLGPTYEWPDNTTPYAVEPYPVDYDSDLGSSSFNPFTVGPFQFTSTPQYDCAGNQVGQAPDFSLSCTPVSQTIDKTQSTSYNITVTSQNNYAGTLQASGTITRQGGNLSQSPVLRFTPPLPNVTNPSGNQTLVAGGSATFLGLITTAANTDSGTYDLNFSVSDGTTTKTCSNLLTVSNAQPSFTLSLSPRYSLSLAQALPWGPTYFQPYTTSVGTPSAMAGVDGVYNLTAVCSNYSGPINSLQINSPYTGTTYEWRDQTNPNGSPIAQPTSIACGQGYIITVRNTNSIPSNQLSTPQQLIPRLITVTGTGA